MVKRYIEVFKNVILLAEQRKNIRNRYDSEGSVARMHEIASTPENVEANRKLYEYLDALDYETIKVLQTIMYLGKNKEYDHKLVQDEIYLDERKYMDECIGWVDKGTEINQMLEKGELHQYLTDGLKIIGITL